MATLQKWMMALVGLAIGMGAISPAFADIPDQEISEIAKICSLVNQGTVTKADLAMLDENEYNALTDACALIPDGNLAESDFAQFEQYATVFEKDISGFDSVFEAHKPVKPSEDSQSH